MMEVPDPTDLASAALSSFERVHTVLTDIDDTITTDGRLSAQAYAAIEALDKAGFRVIPLTGRPAGWCDMIARFWPVAGVVGENGAFAFSYDHQGRRMTRLYETAEATRLAQQAKLRDLAQVILRDVPGAAIAADQPFRIADLAIDFREDVAPLSQAAVQRVVDIFLEHGAVAKKSSIHVNGWFGAYDKLSMTRRFLTEALGSTIANDWDGYVFIGDSPNDEPLFAAVPLSVGVANVREFLGAMTAKPRYVARARGGEGFAELAELLLRARNSKI
jgi:HAD superfamily hydrolase (TIGR01484 family)